LGRNVFNAPHSGAMRRTSAFSAGDFHPSVGAPTVCPGVTYGAA
jgi:hypothetical protein